MARYQTPEQIEVRKAKARAKWAALAPEERRGLRLKAIRREREREHELGPLAAAEKRQEKRARDRAQLRARRAEESVEERGRRLADGRAREAQRMAEPGLRARRLENYAARNGTIGKWENAAANYGVDLLTLSSVCEICSSGDELAVDHDHTSGAVRGRLCRGCNVGIGFFRDNPELLERAVGYLRDRRETDHRASGIGYHPLVRHPIARRLLLMTFHESVLFEREAETDGTPVRCHRVRTFGDRA